MLCLKLLLHTMSICPSLCEWLEHIGMHVYIYIGLTPSALAGRLASDFVVDAFTGAGGNGVQLAAACASVLGIDLSAARLAAAAHNAALYGVAARLDLLAGDVLALLPCVRQVCIT